MSRFGKTVLFLFAFSAIALFTVSHTEAATEDPVKVQVNDTLMEFQEAKPFIDGSEQLQVPVRPIAEKLGFQLEWGMAGDEIHVSMKHEGHSVELTSGDDFANVNGKPVRLPTKIVFNGGNVYLPLRFIEDAFGINVQWDENNGIAIIDADGKYHAPAWYAPTKPDKIVQFAKKYVGVRYLPGGTTPDGFDCSGFVQFVFAQNGTMLQRSSREMYEQAGSKVNHAEPGDLVFFSGHVGIYLGNNQFISATTTYGVHIDSLDNPYWRSNYKGAKRIV